MHNVELIAEYWIATKLIFENVSLGNFHSLNTALLGFCVVDKYKFVYKHKL